MKPTLRQRFIYEVAMWRGLFHCLRAGRHHVATAHGFHPYCWTCFHKFYYSEWVGVLPWLRNLLGYFASGNFTNPKGPTCYG